MFSKLLPSTESKVKIKSDFGLIKNWDGKILDIGNGGFIASMFASEDENKQFEYKVKFICHISVFQTYKDLFCRDEAFVLNIIPSKSYPLNNDCIFNFDKQQQVIEERFVMFMILLP